MKSPARCGCSVRRSQTQVILFTKTGDYNSSYYFVIGRAIQSSKNSRKIYRFRKQFNQGFLQNRRKPFV